MCCSFLCDQRRSDIGLPKAGVGGVRVLAATDFHDYGEAGNSFLRGERRRWAKGLDGAVDSLEFIEELDGLDPILWGSRRGHLGEDREHLLDRKGPIGLHDRQGVL